MRCRELLLNSKQHGEASSGGYYVGRLAGGGGGDGGGGGGVCVCVCSCLSLCPEVVGEGLQVLLGHLIGWALADAGSGHADAFAEPRMLFGGTAG